MPFRVTTEAGGDVNASPFIGARDIATVEVALSGLTSAEVTATGHLKPGVPLTRSGTLVGAPTLSTVGAGVKVSGSGNGTIGAATGGWGKPVEDIFVTFTGTGATASFDVTGTASGYIGSGAVGSAFISPVISFTISDGSTDWDIGEQVRYPVTAAGVASVIYGVTVESVRVADSNNSLSGTVTVAVATSCLVNRDLAEDLLGRPYTAHELAAATGHVRFTNSSH